MFHHFSVLYASIDQDWHSRIEIQGVPYMCKDVSKNLHHSICPHTGLSLSLLFFQSAPAQTQVHIQRNAFLRMGPEGKHFLYRMLEHQYHLVLHRLMQFLHFHVIPLLQMLIVQAQECNAHLSPIWPFV